MTKSQDFARFMTKVDSKAVPNLINAAAKNYSNYLLPTLFGTLLLSAIGGWIGYKVTCWSLIHVDSEQSS